MPTEPQRPSLEPASGACTDSQATELDPAGWRSDLLSTKRSEVSDDLCPHGFYFALFDVLGFEARLRDPKQGSKQVFALYQELIKLTKGQNRISDEMRKKGIDDVFRSIGNGIGIQYSVFSAYASDTIILWSDRTSNTAKAALKAADTIERLAGVRELAWAAEPLPPDPFLMICCEFMCRSIEIGLPMRGALSLGEMQIDREDNIFIGVPLVDCARLEPQQNFLGASLHESFHSGAVPKEWTVSFDEQFKSEVAKNLTRCVALDWPHFWSKTRPNQSIVERLMQLSLPQDKLEVTLRFLQASISNTNRSEDKLELYPKLLDPAAMMIAVWFDSNGEPHLVGAPPEGAPIEKREMLTEIRSRLSPRNKT